MTAEEAAFDIPFGDNSHPIWAHGAHGPDGSVGHLSPWAKTLDGPGVSQPFSSDWNPKGHLNNSRHRMAMTVI